MRKLNSKMLFIILLILACLANAFNITTLQTSTPLDPSSDPQCNTTIVFVVHDRNTFNASAGPEQTTYTTCSTSWDALSGQPPSGWMNCKDQSFAWMFSNLEESIEGFVAVGNFGFEVTHGWEEPG